MSLSKRGAFIVLEGCDCCGKTTQCSMLVNYLNDKHIPVKYLAFPNRKSLSGNLIHSYLTNQQDMPKESIQLLFTTNRWESQIEMKKLLGDGITLVVDRYSYSGIAYGTATGLNFDWCRAPERGLIRPDMVIYLKTDIDNLMKRSNFGYEKYENKEFQKKVSSLYDEIYKTERSYWIEVDANQDSHVIHEFVANETLKLIDKVDKANYHLLWK